jgi:hypothetical protein
MKYTNTTSVPASKKKEAEKTKRKNLHGFQPILRVKRNARKMKSELLPRDAKSCG